MNDSEETKNQDQQNNEIQNKTNTTSNTKKTGNKKVFKVSVATLAAIALVGTGILVGVKFVGTKNGNADTTNSIQENNIPQNSNIIANTIQTIDEQKLESAIKNTIIKLAQKETSSMKSEKNSYAEGHVVLKSEIKDNKIYAYILTEYGVYYLENNKPNMESGSSIPLTLIFEISDSNEYELAEIKEPKDGDEYENSLKEMFPADLISSTSKLSDGTYEEEFNKQILDYLKDIKTFEAQTITESEVKDIENFINDIQNQAFVLTNYTNPKDLLTNEKNIQTPNEVLKYSLNESQYAKTSSSEQNKILWKENGGVADLSTKVSDIKDIILFLQEKMNYSYSEAEVRESFKVNSELDKYVMVISDTLFGKFKVKSATKDGNTYSIKLSQTSEPTSNDIDIVLNKVNEKYCFYSCNLNNFQKLSQEKILEFEKFINTPGNNAFISFNYKNSSDIITDTYDENKVKILSMGIIEGGYAKIASEEEKKIINSEISLKDPYLISLDEIEKFFTEKLATSFGEDEIKKSFKYEYNEKIGKIVLNAAGVLEKNDKIIEGYKAGDFGEYRLTLNTGKKVVLIERIDGSIVFESCTGCNE